MLTVEETNIFQFSVSYSIFKESVNRISYQCFLFTTKKTTLMPCDNNIFRCIFVSIWYTVQHAHSYENRSELFSSLLIEGNRDLKAVLFCEIVVFLAFVSIHFLRLYLSFRSLMLPFCEYAAASDGSPGIIDQILVSNP